MESRMRDPSPREPGRAGWERSLFRGIAAFLVFAIFAIVIPPLRKAPVIRWVENQGGDVHTREGWLTKLLPSGLRSRLDRDLGGPGWREPFDQIYQVYLETDPRSGDLDRLHRFPELKDLWLEGSGVSDSFLASLPKFQSLEKLRLKHTQISAGGLVHLKRLPRLKYLSLENTTVDDEGLAHLAGLANLEYLDLGGTRITDEGLASLAGFPHLEVLDLSSTKITDKGMKQLESSTSLQRLSVWGTGVSDAGVARLEAALPGITIDR